MEERTPVVTILCCANMQAIPLSLTRAQVAPEQVVARRCFQRQYLSVEAKRKANATVFDAVQITDLVQAV